MWVLLGIAVLVGGFVARLNPLAVILAAAVVTGVGASFAPGVRPPAPRRYFDGPDWRHTLPDLEGLTEFFRRLELPGRVPRGKLAFLPSAGARQGHIRPGGKWIGQTRGI